MKAKDPSEPWTPEMIARFLRKASDAELSAYTHTDFQRSPVVNIVPGGVIRELIANERLRRK